MGYKQMPSSEFRLRYASLAEPTEVTVNGRVIGRWTPAIVTVPDEGGGPTAQGVEQGNGPQRPVGASKSGPTRPPVGPLRGPGATAAYRKLHPK